VARYEEKARSKNIAIKVKGERGISEVKGDAQSLGRAVTALLDNAIKFSPVNNEVEIRFEDQRDRVLVSVEDHGIGIAPEIRPRIFDRFFHLERSGDELYSGLGIGLSITRQVIMQHNGMLDLESRPGHGSKFTISLLKWR
jgi:signal transduction histidine kinase